MGFQGFSAESFSNSSFLAESFIEATPDVGGGAPIATDYANNIAYSGSGNISTIGAAGAPSFTIAGTLGVVRDNVYPGGSGWWYTAPPAVNDGFKIAAAVAAFKVDEFTLYQGSNSTYGTWAFYGSNTNHATGNAAVAEATLLATFEKGGTTSGPPVPLTIGAGDTYLYYYLLYVGSPIAFPGGGLGPVLREFALKAGQ